MNPCVYTSLHVVWKGTTTSCLCTSMVMGGMCLSALHGWTDRNGTWGCVECQQGPNVRQPGTHKMKPIHATVLTPRASF